MNHLMLHFTHSVFVHPLYLYFTLQIASQNEHYAHIWNKNELPEMSLKNYKAAGKSLERLILS